MSLLSTYTTSVVSAIAFVHSAHGQWTAHPLPTLGAAASFAGSVRDGYIAGVIGSEGGGRAAVVWPLNTLQPQVLAAPGVSSSVAYAAGESHIGGWIYMGSGFEVHASLWSPATGAIVDLHPPNASSSVIYSMNGSVQGGIATINGRTRAASWSNSPSSFVDLTPTAFSQGWIFAVSSAQQAGSVWNDETSSAPPIHSGRPSLWTGTSSSWIDLTPTQAGASGGTVRAIDGLSQYGSISFLQPADGSYQRAGRWNGSAASWVDMHPSGYLHSGIGGAFGDHAVGAVAVSDNGTLRWSAGFWNVNSNMFVNLNDFLPAGSGSAFAESVWSDDRFVYVVGNARLAGSQVDLPVLWTMPLPSPSAAAMLGLASLVLTRRVRGAS